MSLDAWVGEFGTAYTERNRVDWRTRVGAWWTMLRDLPITSVLEVGCNRGHNLKAIRTLFPSWSIEGIEPNPLAVAEAEDPEVHQWTLEEMVAPRDVVFTAGVLIHIPPPSLDAALRKIHNLSTRYLLAIEYYAPQETMIPYRGLDNMLWKRDYEAEYRQRFPDLTTIRSGVWDREQGFDACTWWLMEKPR